MQPHFSNGSHASLKNGSLPSAPSFRDVSPLQKLDMLLDAPPACPQMPSLALHTAQEIVRTTRATVDLDVRSRKLDHLSFCHAVEDILTLVENLQSGGQHTAKTKGPGDYVTKLDLLLERELTRTLQQIANIPVVSEESPDSHRFLNAKKAWVLDPLDGTLAYLCGQHNLCGPMVTLVENGKACFSVMVKLDGSAMAIAARGRGALLLSTRESYGAWNLTPLKLEASALLSDSLVILNPQSDSRRSHPCFINLMNNLRTGEHAKAVEVRLPHSMAALGLGSGRLGAVVHDNCGECIKQQPWDTLPVQLWVEEGGGVFWGLDGQPYDYRRPMPIVAASNTVIAQRLIELAGK